MPPHLKTDKNKIKTTKKFTYATADIHIANILRPVLRRLCEKVGSKLFKNGFLLKDYIVLFLWFCDVKDKMINMAIRVVEFSSGGTKLDRFLHKNQHTQRKLLNF